MPNTGHKGIVQCTRGNRQTERQADRLTDRLTGRLMDRQTDRQIQEASTIPNKRSLDRLV